MRKPGTFSTRDARMFRHSIDFFDGQIADHVGLAGKQAGDARRFFFYALQDDFLNLRLGAPIVVVARQDQIAAALPADKFIRAGADGVVVGLVAVFFGGGFADDVTGIQAVEQQRERILGGENDGEVVGGFYFQLRMSPP